MYVAEPAPPHTPIFQEARHVRPSCSRRHLRRHAPRARRGAARAADAREVVAVCAAERACRLARIARGSGPVSRAKFYARAALFYVLQREIEEEKANCFEEEELESLRQKVEAVFTLQETPGCMEVLLQGQVGADSVKIKFNAQDTVELEDDEDYGELDEEEAQDEQFDEDEDEEDELPGVHFTADVTRDNKGLQFDCVASSNLTVERVRFLSDYSKDAEDETLYFGPNFIDLELDVQDKFYSYLAERKIDDELAQFITQYADLKEQREYLAFLEDAETFVKH
ncbi:unnamed protein product [Phytophthora lilii]|uniref:Unnamed protein product n=1 Tax=Phytophthora lilii TaxID=2077276 RepID=A0A9W6TVI7_9STRA|nr:unnamed protein product [Phytophthora lilii]